MRAVPDNEQRGVDPVLPDPRVRACAGALRHGGARAAAGAEARDDDECVPRARQPARGAAALDRQPLRCDPGARRQGVHRTRPLTSIRLP